MIQIVSVDQLHLKRKSDQSTAKQKQVVRDILTRVKKEGDQALFDLTERFDGAQLQSMQVSEEEKKEAYSQVDDSFVAALQEAAQRITRYHEKQKQQSWFSPEADGTILGQMVRPLERVGIYVPGGSAAYPSTVLMNAIPAQVAGVENIVMVTPPQADGSIYPPTLVAADIVGVKHIYKVGGAQAIGALAYGTKSIQPVDKIVGPGNIFVALAKQLVYGHVDIDSIAGPSEIVVIADETADPRFVAADLLSQAEHDPMAAAILLTPSSKLVNQVNLEINKQIGGLERREIAATSLKKHGALCVTTDILEAIKVANQLAPEHLELAVADPWNFLPYIQNAGAVFLGHYSPETVGDYFAGPNHVLPTNGTARFFSPLGVDSFVKRMSVIAYSKEACLRDADKIINLAQIEGLTAHAASIRVRVQKAESEGE